MIHVRPFYPTLVSLIVVISIVTLTLPEAVFAVTTTEFNPSATTSLSDPYTAFGKLGTLFSVLFSVIIFAGAITAIIFLIMGAVQYVTSGDAANAAKARSTMTYAVAGLVMLGLTYIFILYFNQLLPH